MLAAPLILAALLVALIVVPIWHLLSVRSTPYAKQRRRMEQARAEYQRSLERL